MVAFRGLWYRGRIHSTVQARVIWHRFVRVHSHPTVYTRHILVYPVNFECPWTCSHGTGDGSCWRSVPFRLDTPTLAVMDADHEDLKPAIDYISRHKLQRHAFTVKNNFLCGECNVLWGCLADQVTLPILRLERSPHHWHTTRL